MCTLVVAARIVPGFPLVVVANRDEQKDRASSPPMRWGEVGKTGFIAPRDDVAGGTWLGWNDDGVFVGITNRFLGPRDPARTSRGAIVIETLAGASARAIHAAMAELDPARYNGFHLVYADAHDVLATVSDGHVLAQLTLGAGLSVVTERSFGADDDARRLAKIQTAWTRLMAGGFDPASATKLLTEHDDADPLAATCIHFDELRYGTRSSMVLAVREADSPQMLWAEGPPCTTPFTEVDLGTGVSKTAKTG
jgi:uncharacterized protein with NRDE domain